MNHCKNAVLAGLRMGPKDLLLHGNLHLLDIQPLNKYIKTNATYLRIGKATSKENNTPREPQICYLKLISRN